ncbi:MAG: class I SAM-dependent methyltransferase [Oscillochloris sp.]|nr:class I SAM-dependent methyltransferase [Oscillochloris sp.]
MIYGYGLSVGARLLMRARARQSLPYLIRPVNYWRSVEYRLVMEASRFTPHDRILDVGSPKLLALYLARVLGARVVATDIDDYFVQTYSDIRAQEGISPERLSIQVEDGRQLSFASGSFSKVYSISVLEHIPDDGDTRCIAELARVLQPGGRCVITVPFWPESRIDYAEPGGFYWASHSTENDNKVFYQRRYSEQDLYERLIKPSGLRLAALRYVGERVMTGSQRELSDLLPVFTGPIQPLMSRMFHSSPVESWRSLKKPLCALLVLDNDLSAEVA